MNRARLLRWLFLTPTLLVLGLAIGSLLHGRRGSRATTSATEQRPPIAVSGPYPRGRWRIAPREELDRVVLWVSHILVRHADAVPSDPPFAPPDWKIQPPLPSRSREEALNRARQLAEQARREPPKFAELARAFSEDMVTRDDGGALGGIRAADLARQGAVLDALALLKPGEVSNVVETEYGFHVLLRRPVPEEVAIAARHIVIGHEAATWLEYRRRAGKTARRSRSEALALARGIAAGMRSAPETFANAVTEHSEHADAELGGDMGTWSSREATYFPRSLEKLAGMKIGEVSEPVETPLGFEILQRVPPAPHPTLAFAAIKLAFHPNAPDTDRESLPNMMPRADAILDTLKTQPARFDGFQRELCCPGVERWRRGQGAPALTQVLEALPIGATATHPVVVDHQIVIARRLPPDTLPAEPAPRFELPAPATPDLDYVISHAAAPGLAAYTKNLAATERKRLGLSGAEEERFVRLHEDLAKTFETGSSEERLRALKETRAKLEELLGHDAFEAYARHLQSSLRALLMQAP